MGCSTSLRSAWLPVTEPGFQPDSCVATLLRLSTDSGAGGRKPARQHGVREAPQVSGSPEGERRAGFWSQRPYLGGLRVQEGAGPERLTEGSRWPCSSGFSWAASGRGGGGRPFQAWVPADSSNAAPCLLLICSVSLLCTTSPGFTCLITGRGYLLGPSPVS